MLKSIMAVALLSAALVTNAQRFHIGVFGGAAAYNGDLTEKLLPKKVTNGVIGGTLNFELTDNITLRGQLSYTILSGADRYNKQADLRARNLSFETKLYEASLVGEYYLLNLYDNRFSPYVFGGLAFYHSNPYAYGTTNQKVFLRRLRTEGQGLPEYPGRTIEKNFQWAIPFGGGIKYALTDNLHVGLEIGLRKLFTDYFDDVSTTYADPADLSTLGAQFAYRGDELPGGNPVYPGKGQTRGSSKYKDIYYFTGLHLTYRLDFSGKKTEREHKFRKNDRLGCPPSVY